MADLASGIVDFAEGGLDARGKSTPFCRQAQPTPCLVEQGDTQLFLQRTDMVADGTVRQVECFGSARYATVAGHGHEGTQGIERGQAVCHVEFLYISVEENAIEVEATAS